MNEPELIARIIDRFTVEELCEIVEVSVEDFIDAFYDRIIQSEEVLEEVGWLFSDVED